MNLLALSPLRKAGQVLFCAGLVLLLTACGMRDQLKYEPLEASQFFADQHASRPLVAGAVHWNAGEVGVLETGRTETGDIAIEIPLEVSAELLERGREQYDIFCAPCHGYDGAGQGMIIQRGFLPPPSLHEQRLRDAPAGHFFDVITHGFGSMYAYDYRIKPGDRWAITAYIRALQVSQNVPSSDLPTDDQQQLENLVP